MVSVHGRPATPSAARSAQIASGERPRRNLVGDPFPQRPGRLQAAAPRPATLALGAALRRRRPVAATTAAARHLTGDRRRRSVHPPGDSRPTCLRILDQRAVDLLAFVQLQRCAWACWYLHRSVLVLAPVIMTGTVHRSMEPGPPCSWMFATSDTGGAQPAPPRNRSASTSTGPHCNFPRVSSTTSLSTNLPTSGKPTHSPDFWGNCEPPHARLRTPQDQPRRHRQEHLARRRLLNPRGRQYSSRWTPREAVQPNRVDSRHIPAPCEGCSAGCGLLRRLGFQQAVTVPRRVWPGLPALRKLAGCDGGEGVVQSGLPA